VVANDLTAHTSTDYVTDGLKTNSTSVVVANNAHSLTLAGLNSVSIGNGTPTVGDRSSYVGFNATGLSDSVSVGAFSTTTTNGVAAGMSAVANGNSAVAIGKSTQSTGIGSVVVGNGSITNGEGGVTVGAASSNSVGDSVVVGYAAGCDVGQTVVIGRGSASHSAKTFVLGYNSTVEPGSDGVVAIGADMYMPTPSQNAVAVGRQSGVYGDRGVTIGYQAFSLTDSCSIGASAQCNANNAVCIGANSGANPGAFDSVSIGKGAVSSTPYQLTLMNGFITGSNANSGVDQKDLKPVNNGEVKLGGSLSSNYFGTIYAERVFLRSGTDYFNTRLTVAQTTTSTTQVALGLGSNANFANASATGSGFSFTSQASGWSWRNVAGVQRSCVVFVNMALSNTQNNVLNHVTLYVGSNPNDIVTFANSVVIHRDQSGIVQNQNFTTSFAYPVQLAANEYVYIAFNTAAGNLLSVVGGGAANQYAMRIHIKAI
jgi:hypothetical protein